MKLNLDLFLYEFVVFKSFNLPFQIDFYDFYVASDDVFGCNYHLNIQQPVSSNQSKYKSQKKKDFFTSVADEGWTMRIKRKWVEWPYWPSCLLCKVSFLGDDDMNEMKGMMFHHKLEILDLTTHFPYMIFFFFNVVLYQL